MASIYDIATIQAGDPLGAARDAAKEASVAFEQYQHQKDIIEDVNRAIEDAKKKSKKGIFGSSLLGTLVPQLFQKAVGVTNPLLAAAIAGIGAGGAEKIRQDKVDATGELEKLKEKYKGREIAQDIDATINTFEEAEKQRLMSNIISSAGSEYLTFGDIVETPGDPGYSIQVDDEIVESMASDIDLGTYVDQLGETKILPGEVKNAMGQYVTPGADVYERMQNLGYGYDESLQGFYRPAGAGTVEDFIPIDVGGEQVVQEAFGVSIPGTASTFNQVRGIDSEGYGDILSALGINVSDEQIEGVLNKLPFLESSTMANLIRTLGPAAFTELMAPKPVVSPYQRPQFRNPFRGGY